MITRVFVTYISYKDIMKGIAGRFIKGMLSVAVSCALLLGGCAPAQSQGDAAAQETDLRPAMLAGSASKRTAWTLC